jgi:dextranase
MPVPAIRDVAPDKATYRPGEAARITVTLQNGDAPLRGRLTLALLHIDMLIETQEQPVDLAAHAAADFVFTIAPPPTPLRGYGLDATLYDEGGQVVARSSGALDVLERWSQAPRYGFLSDFAPGEPSDVEARADALLRYHLNVVQFYDWMWRHYKLLPPTDEFTDALDRRLSLGTVRLAISAVQARGGAALAYGAVYGAEPEYADLHPEQRLYDEQGKPISLAELFYIMNISEQSPWVDLIVAEFAETVRALDFDGIHLDQYGFPKTAFSSTGEPVDLSHDFPPLIDKARAAVVAERADAGVIFNAVDNWPIETVAPTSQDAVYIEVWPPYDTYNDLRALIREGKRLGGDKQVILAAYLTPFGEATAETVSQAEAAALLSTAVIAASGGFHLLLGEQDGVLCDPYYPKYATLRPDFALTMRQYYDFLVRYEELLIAPDLTDFDNDRPSLTISGVPTSATAQPGHIWVIERGNSNHRIVHLVNLLDQSDVAWNAPRTTPQPLRTIELQMSDLPSLKQILLLSPEGQRPQPLDWTEQDGVVRVTLPGLQVWGMLVCVL